MSFLKRIFTLLTNPVRYVGRDLEGNRFYEYPGISSDSRRKRTVQYKDPEDVWKYIGGGRRLPVQWSMWLSHTRKSPPTLEELQQDSERQRLLLANVAAIEARDRGETEARLRIEQSIKEETAKRAQIEQSKTRTPPEVDVSLKQPGSVGEIQGASRSMDEAESWSPKTLRRRG